MGERSIGNRRLTLAQCLDLLLQGAVQMEVVRRTGHETGLGQPLEGVRDRRSLGRDQLPEQTVGQRQRQPDPARLHPSPAVGQMPQEQDESNLEARLGGDRSEHVELERPPAGAVREDPDDLREGPHAFGKIAVEHREPGAAQRPPAGRAHEHLVGGGTKRLQEVPGADQLGRGAAPDPDLQREQAVEDQQSQPVGGRVEPPREIARPDSQLQDPGGRELSRGDPRPEVELIGELSVDVEQVGVERDRLRSIAGKLRMSGPSQRPAPDIPSVFDGHDSSLGFGRAPDVEAVYAPNRAAHQFQCCLVTALTGLHICPQASGRTVLVCLAIPGQVIEIVDDLNRLAKVDVAGVRRTVNVGLLDGEDGGVGPGDWVLIHVGFAISKVDEEEARATRDLLVRMGADYEQELEQLKASVIE